MSSLYGPCRFDGSNRFALLRSRSDDALLDRRDAFSFCLLRREALSFCLLRRQPIAFRMVRRRGACSLEPLGVCKSSVFLSFGFRDAGLLSQVGSLARFFFRSP